MVKRISIKPFIRKTEKKGSCSFNSGKPRRRIHAECLSPKKPCSPYYYYLVERKGTLLKDKPDMKPEEVISMIGDEWKLMDETAKALYIKAAQADKLRYKKEKMEYMKTLTKPDKITTSPLINLEGLETKISPFECELSEVEKETEKAETDSKPTIEEPKVQLDEASV